MIDRIKAAGGFLIGAILFIWMIPILLVIGIFMGIAWILSLPGKKAKKTRRRAEIVELYNKGVHGYLMYDRNFTISDLLEQEFIPKYENKLVIDHPSGDRLSARDQVDEQVRSIFEDGDPDDIQHEVIGIEVDDDDEAEHGLTCLYLFKSDGSIEKLEYAGRQGAIHDKNAVLEFSTRFEEASSSASMSDA